MQFYFGTISWFRRYGKWSAFYGAIFGAIMKPQECEQKCGQILAQKLGKEDVTLFIDTLSTFFGDVSSSPYYKLLNVASRKKKIDVPHYVKKNFITMIISMAPGV